MKLTAFLKAYGTDEACRTHMESVRWPAGPVCPRCGVIGEAAEIATRPGTYRCRACEKQFTVTVGTAMEGSHLPLRTWYLAMYLMLSTAKPISAMSLSRHLELQYRTCWHLLHRLRAMLGDKEGLPLSGVIEAVNNETPRSTCEASPPRPGHAAAPKRRPPSSLGAGR